MFNMYAGFLILLPFGLTLFCLFVVIFNRERRTRQIFGTLTMVFGIISLLILLIAASI